MSSDSNPDGMEEFCPRRAASEFIHALNNGDLESVKRLLSMDKTLLARPKKGDSGKQPLHFAIEFRQPEIALYLIDQGADINDMVEEQTTFLHYAAIYGLCEVIKVLLQKGLQIDQPSQSGITALAFSIHFNKPEVTRFLIEQGASVHALDTSGKGILTQATSHGRLESAELLIQNGADVNAIDHQGQSPLYEALLNGYLEAAELLISHGANPHCLNHKNESLLHGIAYACRNRFISHAHEIRLSALTKLIQVGVDVRTKNTEGETALDLLKKPLEDDGSISTHYVKVLIEKAIKVLGDIDMALQEKEQLEQVTQTRQSDTTKANGSFKNTTARSL